MIKQVAVGLSGGVDSAVAALLLKQKGFNVIGVFMKNWDETDEIGRCSLSQDRADAFNVSSRLGIPFVEVNFVKQYWFSVFSYFLQDYEAGLTPNPDIMCNRYIKFNEFFNFCLNELKADAVATGHYARTSYGNFLENKDPSQKVRLLQPADKFKDQTFFLSQVPQQALQKVMFPLGNYLKSEVKEMALKYYPSYICKKKESTGVCFIGKRKFQDFITEYIPFHPGPMKDLTTGKILSDHNGLHLWTIGQCSRIEGFPKRYFVAKKDVSTNTIYVVPGTNHPALFARVLYAAEPFWIAKEPLNSLGMVECRFRFQHTKPTIQCCVMKLEERLLIFLERPLKAITPGQFAVFYSNDECLGSARILQPGPSLYSLGEQVPSDYREYEHYKRYIQKYIMLFLYFHVLP